MLAQFCVSRLVIIQTIDISPTETDGNHPLNVFVVLKSAKNQ